jgi:hypothetical protein
MRGSPEVVLRGCFAAAARRLRVLAAAHGAAAGLSVAAFLSLIGAAPADGRMALALGLGLGVAGAAVAATLRRAPTAALAARIERATPASRNLIATSAELLDAGAPPARPVPAHLTARILNDASAVASTIDLRRLFPARRAMTLVAASLVLWSVTLVATRRPSLWPAGSSSASTASTGAVLRGIDVEITPPHYTGRAPERVRDPERIQAFAGSRITLTIGADAAAIDVETLAGRVSLSPDSRGAFTRTILADSDGFIAIAPQSASGTLGARRLIGLSVLPDLAPRVRLTAPGRDLRLPAGPHTVPLEIEADDDVGLASMRLVYTRVSGSGENFTFTSGEVPVAVSEKDARTWSARASWALAPLGLEPGDMVIYRAIAADRMPGRAPAESDAFIVEILGPGAVPSDGFAVDDRVDRYAISQQMVIVKTQRLLAERATMSAGDFLERSRDLAAEQRQVRAEFVFMMGGELADEGIDPHSLNEEEEAAGEDDLAAGRLANQGRADLMRAIRSMSRAATRLYDADTEAALPIEQDALTYLQRAFSRSRYILRTLGARAQLDFTRRLTGVVSDVARDVRPAAAAAPNPRLAALRTALADVAALASDPTRATDSGVGRAVAIAQQVLRLDPSSTAYRDATSALVGMGRATTPARDGANAAAIDAALDRTATRLAELIRTELLIAPEPASASLDALAGALADALRREARR